jgi:hypothetical protein
VILQWFNSGAINLPSVKLKVKKHAYGSGNIVDNEKHALTLEHP